MKKKMWKRWISLALTAIILFCSVNIVLADSTDDIWRDIQSYYPFSNWAVDVGTKYKIIFLEDNKRATTRAEVVNLLFNLTLFESKSNSDKSFTDISSVNEVLKKRIQKMSDKGIISGYEDGTFRPTNSVTRAEFIAMLARMNILNKKKGSKNIFFNDLSYHWAEREINKIASLGVVSGKGDNKFCPEDSITPQELVIILDRLVNLDCIEKEKVNLAILDTFKSKQYTEKEQYIIERMYNDFDRVQAFMEYNFPYKNYYDYTNWHELATAEDIQHIIYFMMSRKTKIKDYEEKEIFDGIGNIVKQNNRFGGKNYSIADILYIINSSQRLTQATRWIVFDYYDDLEINYTNKSDFNEKDLQQLTLILAKKQNAIFDNMNMEFPIYAPITKYILNYLAMKIEETYIGYRESWGFNFNEYLGLGTKKEFVTIKEELPSNYADFPYIIKGIPKEIYEKHYVNENRYIVRKPVECYGKYSKAMSSAANNVSNFYNVILNVDYRNLNEQNILSTISNCFYYVSDEEIYKYINYIKENEIILKGTGFAVPGTLYISDGWIYVRTVLKFEVVSAKEMKNLLFGDMQFGLPEDIKYNAKQYTLYSDIGVQGGPIIWDNKVRYDIYKLSYQPILFGIHWDGFAPIKFNLPQ